MKIIITGATGFVGRDLAESFHNKGVEVIRLIIEVCYNPGESVKRNATNLHYHLSPVVNDGPK